METLRNRRRAGSSIVEFALASGLLLTFFFGVIEVGRIFEVSVALDSAVRAGALYGGAGVAQRVDVAGIAQAARQAAPQLGNFQVNTDTFCGCENGDTGACAGLACPGAHKYLSVTGVVPISSITLYVALPQTFTLRSTATMRLVQ